MLSLLFNLNLWGSVYSQSVTGLPCSVRNASRIQYGGACVPLDNNDHNWDCSNVYGFLVDNVCEQEYGESMQKVHDFLHRILLILKVSLLYANRMLERVGRLSRILSGFCEPYGAGFYYDPYCDFLPSKSLQTSRIDAFVDLSCCPTSDW